MSSKYRIGAVFKRRVHEALVKKALLNGISDSAQVSMLVVKQLVADGDLTEADLKADRDEEPDSKESDGGESPKKRRGRSKESS